MKLYVIPGSPNSRKVVAAAEFLDLKPEMISVNTREGQHKSPEFLALNPNGMVPALQDGKVSMWESNAIMIYLCSKKPGNTLFPTEPTAQADVLRWMFWDQGHFTKAATAILVEKFYKPQFFGQEGDTAKLEAGMQDFNRFAAVLDQHLTNRTFICGDNVTLADISIASPMMYAEMVGMPLEKYPSIRNWRGRLEEMPAWVRSASQL